MWNDEPNYDDIPLAEEPSWPDEAPPEDLYEPGEWSGSDEDYIAYEQSLAEITWIPREEEAPGEERTMLAPAVKPVDFSLLNPKQAEAVAALSGVIQVVAGPGSGKTRVLTDRIRNLLIHEAPLTRILAVTFTKKAAAEMRERLMLSGRDSRQSWVTTFHSACMRIVRAEARFFGLPSEFTILSESSSKTILTAVIKEHGIDSKGLTGPMKKVISTIKNEYFDNYAEGAAIGHSTLLEASNSRSGVPSPEQILDIMAKYDAAKLEVGAVDFDDLQTLALRLLADPEAGAKWRSWFEHVSIDEYQDTNPIQERLVQLLSTGAKSLFVVGDADQSIYGFRGAVPGVMEDFPDRVANTRTVVLDDNYRSTPEILDAVREVISKNAARARSPLHSNKDCGGKPVIVGHVDNRSEQWAVIDSVTSLIESGVPGTEIAILCGINAVLSEYETLLFSRSIPYSVSGKQRFIDRKSVQAALAMVTCLVRPDNTHAVMSAAELYPAVGPKYLSDSRRAARAEGISLLDYLRKEAEEDARRKKPTKRGESLGQFFEDLGEAGSVLLRGTTGNPAGDCFRIIGTILSREEFKLDDVDKVNTLASSCEMFTSEINIPLLNRNVTYTIAIPGYAEMGNLSFDEHKRGWYAEFVVSGGDPDSLFTEASVRRVAVDPASVPYYARLNGAASALGQFLDHCTLDSAAEDAEEGVILSTVHSSKGREFDHVFITAVEAGILPRGGGSAAEERRLMFVAMSRARVGLQMHWARTRKQWGKIMDQEPSLYLMEIQDHCQIKGLPLHEGPAMQQSSTWW